MHLHENTAQISKSVCPNSWLFTAFPWNLGNALTLSSAIPPWAHLILSETASHLCSNSSFSFLLEPLTNLQSSITVSYTLDAYLGTTPRWQKWKEKKKQTHIFRICTFHSLRRGCFPSLQIRQVHSHSHHSDRGHWPTLSPAQATVARGRASRNQAEWKRPPILTVCGQGVFNLPPMMPCMYSNEGTKTWRLTNALTVPGWLPPVSGPVLAVPVTLILFFLSHILFTHCSITNITTNYSNYVRFYQT